MPHRVSLALLVVILRPADQSVVKPGPLEIIAKTSAVLALDGKPLSTRQPAPGVQTTTITPSAGLHQLTAGEESISFFVGAGAPANFKDYRTHPPQTGCPTCHKVEWEADTQACLGCHDQNAFPKTHTHNTEVLIECQTCHLPHGSTERAHLKMPKSTACKQCHG